MTTVVLATITAIAVSILVGVLVSLARAMRPETATARLRREGLRAFGTVVDNSMTSTAQQNLAFAPIVEFRAHSGREIRAAALQRAATMWPRGMTVEVAYDAERPERFVLTGAPPRGPWVANLVVALIVVLVLVGSMVAMYHLWWKFRYDRDDPGEPTGVGASHPATRPGP